MSMIETFFIQVITTSAVFNACEY